MSAHKSYLGDSVYADFDEYGCLVLTTENGMGPSNRIILEPEVLRALDLYRQRKADSLFCDALDGIGQALGMDSQGLLEDPSSAALALAAERERIACFWDDTEARSAEAHAVYQKEAHRRGDVRHPDAFQDLSEATKEWDRVLVRWVAATIRGQEGGAP